MALAELRILDSVRLHPGYALIRVVETVLYFAMVDAIFGLSGLTLISLVQGITTRSMSSIGMAPRSAWSPMTNAPAKPTRFWKRNSTGPT
jgi:hypothetical protein